jgi:hypothetical protein
VDEGGDVTAITRTNERLAHYAAIGDRKAFKSMTHMLDMFDTQEHTAASKVKRLSRSHMMHLALPGASCAGCGSWWCW